VGAGITGLVVQVYWCWAESSGEQRPFGSGMIQGEVGVGVEEAEVALRILPLD